MLSYLHAFHAGNFADVQKHAVQVLTLIMLQAKPSPIACFDTHAGSAVYDLDSERARKTGEAETGIQRLWQQRRELAAGDWKRLLETLGAISGEDNRIARYPGSPEWFRRYLRDQDTLTVFELHPAEKQSLAAWAPRSVRVCQEDGLKGLLRQLPPRQPRLLVLMDPSYEVKSDYQVVADTLIKAWQKCRHGVYLIWYPLLPEQQHQKLLDTLCKSQVRKILKSELTLSNPPPRGMTGSGMLIVNPPWGLDARLESMLGEAAQCLDAQHRTDWLVPE
ncbi:23S rRNA (adenine(2030)-N(6))-methyltransferase RlmJ [Marinobacter sp.]|uniref:23S rRNA (adenine(2030)-N(6))-methyltransferase RlmJ n=1 Tax=Marinobacter sp. TaxID=50741 RepID=UPI00384A5A84